MPLVIVNLPTAVQSFARPGIGRSGSLAKTFALATPTSPPLGLSTRAGRLRELIDGGGVSRWCQHPLPRSDGAGSFSLSQYR
jgi:hypothetical protein